MEEEKLVFEIENIKQEPVDELSISDYHITENQSHNSDDFVCNTCHKTFCAPSSSRDRKLEIECPFCCKSFSSKTKQHVKCSKAGKQLMYKCNICLMSCEKKFRLKQHLRVHTKPFACDLCSYIGSQKASLSSHMRNRHISKKLTFKCIMCAMIFSCNSKLKLHLNGHTKPFGCDLCSYNASAKAGLSSHMESYHRPEAARKKLEKAKSFQCKICQKCVETKYKIIEHILFNHSDFLKLCKNVEINELTEEPDCCVKCSTKVQAQFVCVSRSEFYQLKCKYSFKCFNNKKCLRIHERMTHLENKKLKCDNCSFVGISKKQLTYHKRRSH